MLLEKISGSEECFILAQLLHEDTWYTALVSGFYRKDNLHQLALREYPPEFEDSKVMGEFHTPSVFELEGGGQVKWRRASRQLVTSKDVRKYLNFTVEERRMDSDLWGKALKVGSRTTVVFCYLDIIES